MDVSNQAGRFNETRRREEIMCRRESLDRVTERPHEPFHRLAKEPVIFDDGNQLFFRHRASGSSFESAKRRPNQCVTQFRRSLRQRLRQGNAITPKPWRMLRDVSEGGAPRTLSARCAGKLWYICSPLRNGTSVRIGRSPNLRTDKGSVRLYVSSSDA